MMIAFCRDCKVVIAAGALAPQRTYVDRVGKRRSVNTMPFHRVKGKEHRSIKLLSVPDEPIIGRHVGTHLKSLTDKYKDQIK